MKKDSILLITTGDYSDYYVQGLFKVIKEINKITVVSEFNEACPAVGRDDRQSKFLAWLAASGYVEDIEHEEWHIGSYGQVSVT